VRTPRIVLLDWKGDPVDAQNQWRRFVLAHYSPRGPDGKVVTVPLAFGSWGAEPVADKLRMIQAIHDLQIPIDVYWVDAGWYGTTGTWARQRGNWTPNPAYYPPPEGLRALGSVLRDDGYGFLLWLEAEAADPGSDLLVKHPGWYLRKANPHVQALLNFGNPNALAGMTAILSGIFRQSLVTWYRQDFNVEPDGYWSLHDAPDRIGITEMKDIEGLYAFWDALRRDNPGLEIDNCASGGRRLDIETISRSVALWRSDLGCRRVDPTDNQNLTQGLDAWVPLNSGVFGYFGGPSSAQVKASDVALNKPAANPALPYVVRSGYNAGAVFGTHRISIQLMKPVAEEFDQVRPYFSGDFYPMTPYSKDPKTWHVLQLDRPDLKSGVIIALRRPASTIDSMAPALRGIDPNAQYHVEMRPGFDPGETKTMFGQDLAHLTLHIPDHPGSLLVFYKQK
jgi:alpha-galactosidase